MKKPIYCCNGLKGNLNNDCSYHGWTCPDRLIYFDEKNGEVYIPNSHDGDNPKKAYYWVIDFCPFCGKKIGVEEI